MRSDKVQVLLLATYGYYLIRIGDEPDERSWKFMDKWLRPVDYTLF